jgi:predicted esterase
MKFLLPWLVLVLPLSARTWMDTTGRAIEADFVRADATAVTVLFKGKETKLPLDRLSESDRKWIADQQTNPGGASAPTAPAAVPGEFSLAGTPVKAGGPTVTVQTPLTERTLKEFKGTKPTKLKLAVKLPTGFDPAKPQHVLWVSAAINSDKERVAGNCAAIGGYANTATAAGWVVVAADTDAGNPRKEDNLDGDGADEAVHRQAVETLAAVWPNVKTWQFACAGFSGGAKASFYRVGQLLASELNVTGLFLGGCNENRSAGARSETRFPKSKLRKVKVFVSNGKADTVSTPDHAKAVADGVESDFGDVKLELYEGGHGLNQGELKKALDWFAEPQT